MTDRERFIALVDSDSIRVSDAIILLEGDGFNRCGQVLELYKKGYAKNVVFSGGVSDPLYGSFPLSKILPILTKGGIPKARVIHESTSRNTREQAVEVIKLANSLGWKRIILVASNYHQYRAYLTFLRIALNLGQKIIIYNAPAGDLSWFKKTGWGTRFDLLDQEFSKIIKYSKLSHLATFKEAISYQRWKEQQT